MPWLKSTFLLDPREPACISSASCASRTEVIALDENEVVAALCRHLTAAGYRVHQQLSTTQQGVDVIAESPSGKMLYVEAKGATSSREGSARFGKGFNASQVFDRVAKGLYTGLCLRADHPDADKEDVALAFPDTPDFRKRLEPIRKQLSDAGVDVYLASADGTVTRL